MSINFVSSRWAAWEALAPRAAQTIRRLVVVTLLATTPVLAVCPNALAATYTATFTGAMNGGDANVRLPFRGNGFAQSQPFSGTFAFDDSLIPSSGITNVFFSSLPEIDLLSDTQAFSFNFGTLSFDLSDNLDAERAAGIQYKDGQFNGFVFLTNFTFMGSNYRLNIEGPTVTVYLLNSLGFPILSTRYINAHVDVLNASLTDIALFDPNSPSPVPIPGALALFASALGLGGFLVRRKRMDATT